LSCVVTVMGGIMACLLVFGGRRWIASGGVLIACADAFLLCALWVLLYADLTDFRTLLNSAVAMR
jgi:hypothetical protein